MTQVNRAQDSRNTLASTPRARVRTLATRRADLEHRIRLSLATDPAVALTDLPHVSARLKELRKPTGLKQHEAAAKMSIPPRTFQSWENGEVETDRANYAKMARFYSRRLKRKVTVNWILFGQDEEPPLSQPNGDTPDLLASVSGGNGNEPEDLQARLRRIEQQQNEILTRLDGVQASLATLAPSLVKAVRDALAG